MSGYPTQEGAAQAVRMVDALADLDAEMARLQRVIDDVQPHVRRLAEARVERVNLERKLGEHLRAMDCDAPGNHGFEGRFAWLLMEVVKRARGGA